MRSFALAALALAGCIGGADTFTVSGRVQPVEARGAGVRPLALERRITHIMAVDPEAAAPQRTLATVGDDGSFELDVEVGKPYVFVLVDDTAVGADMVVAVFRANTLDTLSPQFAGHLDLGDVEVDAEAQTASSGVPYEDLIASLGLDASAAEFLGSIDDLSLRYANPDIDGNGVIDLDEDHQYAIDFHLRATMYRGATDARLTVADITDAFPADAGADAATPHFDLSSIYVLYPAALDTTDYVGMGPPGAGLQHGARFTATLAGGEEAPANTSFSGLGFGDTRGWGPDYDHEHGHAELPGSSGTPATLAFTLGASGTTLTFSNVVTRTAASLSETGSIAIFLRLATDGAGAIAAVDYKWMKRDAAAWTPATAAEIAVSIGSDGGYVSVHRVPSWHDEVGIAIPAEPSGSIAWPHGALAPSDICGLAVSFDDKLGLRHFIGGVDANPGVTCSN